MGYTARPAPVARGAAPGRAADRGRRPARDRLDDRPRHDHRRSWATGSAVSGFFIFEGYRHSFPTEICSARSRRSCSRSRSICCSSASQRRMTPWTRSGSRPRSGAAGLMERHRRDRLADRPGQLAADPAASRPGCSSTSLSRRRVSLAIAVAIALPIGLWIGHTRRGAAVAVNLANLGRALPDAGGDRHRAADHRGHRPTARVQGLPAS